MTTVIRSATKEDIETLSCLGRESFTQTFGHLYAREDLNSFLDSDHSVRVYQRLVNDGAYRVWITDHETDGPIGYLVTGPCDLPVPDLPQNSGELVRLYVLQGYQGSGLGTKLMDVALAALRAHYDHIYLSVYAENHGAQKLYARYGFKKILDYFYKVGEHLDPEWVMKLQD